MVTLTYNGGQRAMPNYNVMGVAKAALEASVRYLAVDFGPSAIRVNRDLGRPDPHARGRRHRRRAADVRLPAAALAAARGVTLDEIGGAALYLLSDLSTGVTGDIHFVDSGYNIITMPQPSALNDDTAAKDAAQ
jgi:enoyl-[acyl-carrier protein] reductase I